MEVPKEEESAEWKTFTLTFVEYPENDALGKILAITSLAPLVIVIMFLTFFAAKRDMHTITYGIGTILNGILNYVLKHAIQEARPEHIVKRTKSKLWEQYGMPSSHSQFMFFVSTYLALFVAFRLNHQGSTKLGRTLWLLTCIACLGVSAFVAFGRVYLGYHSWPQVYWGSGIGSAFALFWFLVTQYIFAPTVFQWLCSTRLFEFFLIRDYSDIPNVMWFDYFHAKNEAKSRLRKKSSFKKNQ